MVFSNGIVSFTMCFINGLCVLTQHGWSPWSDINDEDRDMIRRCLDHNSSCPQEWRDIIYTVDDAEINPS